METEDPTPSTPLMTLSARLLDADFREGYQIGYEIALVDLMARCEFLLKRTAAISDLRHHVKGLKKGLKAELAQEVGSNALPHAEVHDTDPEA